MDYGFAVAVTLAVVGLIAYIFNDYHKSKLRVEYERKQEEELQQTEAEYRAWMKLRGL